MGSRRNPADCRVGLFGVPYDGTTSFRPGMWLGPAAIRDVSNGLETCCPQLDLDLEDPALLIWGPLTFPSATGAGAEGQGAAAQAVLSLGLRPLMLGGEHSISTGVVAAVDG